MAKGNTGVRGKNEPLDCRCEGPLYDGGMASQGADVRRHTLVDSFSNGAV